MKTTRTSLGSTDLVRPRPWRVVSRLDFLFPLPASGTRGSCPRRLPRAPSRRRLRFTRLAGRSERAKESVPQNSEGKGRRDEARRRERGAPFRSVRIAIAIVDLNVY